jgi:hypothetical protein
MMDVMKMNNIRIAVLAATAVSLLVSCNGFLDPYPSAIRDEEYVISSPTTM